MASRFSRLRRKPDDAQPTEATEVVPGPEGSAPATEIAPPPEGATEPATEVVPPPEGATGEPAADPQATVAAEPVAESEPAAGSETLAGSDPVSATGATEVQVIETNPDEATEAVVEGEPTPGFIARGRLRRRLRYVRRAREIALRDVGGLVFELHRFERDRSDLVDQKLASLGALDAEMRALEAALDDRQEQTILREPGLMTCARCGALCGSDAKFCSNCGLPLGPGASLPAGPTPTGPAEGTALGLPAPTPPPEPPAPEAPADESEPPTRVS